MRPELSHGISLNTLNNLIVRSRNDQFYKVLCISCLLAWLVGSLAAAAHQPSVLLTFTVIARGGYRLAWLAWLVRKTNYKFDYSIESLLLKEWMEKHFCDIYAILMQIIISFPSAQHSFAHTHTPTQQLKLRWLHWLTSGWLAVLPFVVQGIP